MPMKKAIILLSGGLDSATCLAIAKDSGFDCHALSFIYGQRHVAEMNAAKAIAKHMGIKDHRVVQLDIGQFGSSALTDTTIEIPRHRDSDQIPITYVPARNTVFLSIALGLAEVLGAYDIFIGANAVDYSGYPDCRPEFIQAFQSLANVATKAGVEGKHFNIQAPLIELSKADIIRWGMRLGLDYEMTVSCYQLNDQGEACGHCDSCVLRKRGFQEAGTPDPTHYQ